MAYIKPTSTGTKFLQKQSTPVDVSAITAVQLYEKYFGSDGVGNVTFPLTKPYLPGTNTLLVFRNGQKQELGNEYTETDAYTVTFASALPDTDVIEFMVMGAYRVDSTELAGAVADLSPRKNWVINGDFQVAQRGASFTNAGLEYTLDNWEVYGSAALLTVDQLNASATLNALVPDVKHYIRVWNNDVADDGWRLRVPIEDVWSLSGKTVTLSYWLHADAAYNMIVQLQQNFGSGGSTTIEPWSTTIVGSAVWTKHTHTFDIPTVYGKTIGDGSHLTIDWLVDDVTTGAFRLADVQLEEGSRATEFERLSYGEQLQKCLRFYHDSLHQTHHALTIATSVVGNTYYSGVAFPVPMRTLPYVTIVSVSEAGSAFNGITEASITTTVYENTGFRWSVDATATSAASSRAGIRYTAKADL